MHMGQCLPRLRAPCWGPSMGPTKLGRDLTRPVQPVEVAAQEAGGPGGCEQDGRACTGAAGIRKQGPHILSVYMHLHDSCCMGLMGHLRVLVCW